MTRRLLLAICATLTLIVLPLSAHEGHEHKILGTVSMAAADHVMVKDKAGKEFTVHITGETKVLKGKKPAVVGDIRSGMRVVVTAVTEKMSNVERMRAKVIELAAMSAPK
ncbi:MAG: peptidylprolyl isomerase [Vicinamibacteraceae bacterium]